MSKIARYDVVILGAGAAGLFCAAVAGRRGRRVLLLDHASRAGKKVLASGGGRSNFTNRTVSAANYVSDNPHFATSALARFTPADICALLNRRGVGWVEEEDGKLFCARSSRDLLAALIDEAADAGAATVLGAEIRRVERGKDFAVETSRGRFEAPVLVIATGGLSYRDLGASDLGYRIAKQMGLRVVPPRPALVPLIWNTADKKRFMALSGISLEAGVRCGKHASRGGLLFTHRGLSGPAILQISVLRQQGEAIGVDLLPGTDALAFLREMQVERSKAELKTVLAGRIPKRLAETWCTLNAPSRPLRYYALRDLRSIAAKLQAWELCPAGTEGFTVAEVTAGGVDTDTLSSKTMEAKKVRGLFFIGEIVDVTGMLGGFNLHWAWASGQAAGTVV